MPLDQNRRTATEIKRIVIKRTERWNKGFGLKCLEKKCWLSRRQGLEKEAGLRRIPLQPAGYSHYNEEKNKMSK